MLIKLNLDGSISRVTPEHIYQGSVAVDIVQVASEIPETSAMELIVTQVDGTPLTPLIMDSSQFIDGYRVWSTKLDKSITQDKGVIKMTFRVYGVGDEILKTATLNVPIEESNEIPLPPEPTPDVYEQILRELGKKQNINDDKLINANKNVVDVINEHERNIADLDGRVTQNETDINTNMTNIQSNEQRIENLEQTRISGIDIIGTIKREQYPTNEELNDFVFEKRQRLPENGDIVRFILIVPQGTDRFFEYSFANNMWSEPNEIPPFEKSDNSTYGIVKGSLGDNTKDTQVNVDSGEFVDIRTKNLNGDYEDIAVRANRVEQKQKDIISGTQQVGSSLKAKFDEVEDTPINEKYLTLKDGISRAEADERYAPKYLAEIGYITKDGVVDTIPSGDGVQFEVTTNAITPKLFFELEDTVEKSYYLTNQQTSSLLMQIGSVKETKASFRFVFSVKKQGGEWIDATIDLSNEISFNANTIVAVPINSILNSLTEPIELNKGDLRKLRVEIIPKDSVENTYTLYCNEARQSTFYLVSQSVSVVVNYVGEPKELAVQESDFVFANGKYEYTIPQTIHQQPKAKFYDVWGSYTNGARQEKLDIDFSVDGTDIIIIADNPIDCTIYIASGTKSRASGILRLTNPNDLNDIDYNVYGSVVITQTEESKMLTLADPISAGIDYKVYVFNDPTSTFPIDVNGVMIDPNSFIYLQWVGGEWKQLQPYNTSEITDDIRDQNLNNTLADFDVDILTLTNEKMVAKSVELKDGIPVTNLIDFYRYFYDLRKGNVDTWEVEVGGGKNENVMDIFGYPIGELPTNSAELIIKRKATSGIGYTLELIFASEKTNTTHTAFVRGWIFSGTSYDKYIHFTGWRNAKAYPDIESTIQSSDWAVAENKGIFKYEYTIIQSVPDYTNIRLINDNAIAFADGGFSILNADKNGITIGAIKQPTEPITLKFKVEAMQ